MTDHSPASTDHRAFVRALPSATTIELSAIDSAKSARHLIVHLSAIVLLATLIIWEIPLWPALLLPQGILLVALFNVEHEATHKTVFQNGQVNDFVGRCIGLILMLPFEWFRYFHMAHHRYTNLAEKDPELAGGPRPDSHKSLFWHLSGLPYWISMAQNLWAYSFGKRQEDFLPRKSVSRIRIEARTMLALYALACGSLLFTHVLLWIWILPVLLGQPFLRLFLLAEHGHCPQVANMFENTRTTLTSFSVRYLTWNASYHVEHHTFPNVPSHNLPQLHDLMANELQVTSDGYTQFAAEYARKLGNR